jgi:hypothetical protein
VRKITSAIPKTAVVFSLKFMVHVQGRQHLETLGREERCAVEGEFNPACLQRLSQVAGRQAVIWMTRFGTERGNAFWSALFGIIRGTGIEDVRTQFHQDTDALSRLRHFRAG